MKLCTVCKQEKPNSDFHLVAKSKTKRRSACKVCTAKIRSEKRKKIGSYEWFQRKHEHTKRSAKKRGWIYSLTISDIKTLMSYQKCYYCEEEPEKKTIDRVDNNLGYTKENCVMACLNCNLSKKSMTLEQIKLFYEKIEKFYRKTKDRTV